MTKERLLKLGLNIRIERVRNRLSQEELAELVDVCTYSIQKIENGKQNPSAILIYDISKALNVPIENLYNNIE